MSFNLTWCLLSMRPQAPLRTFVYGILVGDRSGPGIVRTAVALVNGDRAVLRRVLPSLAGQLHAIALVVAGRRVSMITFLPRPAHANADFQSSARVPSGERPAEVESSAGSNASARG
jgi:hypothetical protein